MAFDFLPTWPPAVNNFVVFGLVLWAGLVGGELAHRSGYVPRITGYIAIGFVLGPAVLGLFSSEMVAASSVFVDIALGLILFQIGEKLPVRTMSTDPWLLGTWLGECAATFALVFGALWFLGIGPVAAALIAAIAMSSSPAVVLLVMREMNASGPASSRCLQLTALNNLLAFFVFSLILPFLHKEQAGDWAAAILQPLYQAAGALALGFVLAHATVALARLIGRRENAQFALLVGVIVLGVGLAHLLHVSFLLTLLALGVFCRYFDRQQTLMEVEFGHGGDIFFVILFVVAGASLHVEELMSVGWLAAVFVAARFVAKMSVVYGVTWASGYTHRQSFGIALALTPMAGMAIGLVESVKGLYPEASATLAAIVLASVAILETVGPLATMAGLRLAREVAADRPLDH
ncbi:MAG TPA: cation:proton antiporter [Pelomicrobium sp.]|nr:cation:proton antiporter [Pelomicrobium sp.]